MDARSRAAETGCTCGVCGCTKLIFCCSRTGSCCFAHCSSSAARRGSSTVAGVASAADAGTVRVGDFTVNRMGYGAMRITGKGIWADPPDPDASKQLLNHAVEIGVNFIDTAAAYASSERLIGEALAPYPDGLVIATKAGHYRTGPEEWEIDCRPETLRRQTEESLAFLRVDELDLQQLHRVDKNVPIEESVGAFKELQDEGKVRHIGVSNVTVEQLRRAQSVAQIVSVQNEYNLGNRESDDVVDVCEADELAFLPWYPLDAGRLAGRGGPLEEVAAKHNATGSQVALAWLLQRSPAILVIPGTNSREHLEENVAAAALRLDDDDLAALSS
jgi:pyridoxine 4-dehydrogenase